MTAAKTIFVGLSGGVDSSVAALRLIHQGYRVVGVFIKVWHPDFMVCNWEQERLDAMRVAAKLGIPFLTCDAEAAYRDAVAHYFIESYRQGITPNPDVMCNKEVKFGAFMDFAKTHGADGIATGHYAQRLSNNGNYTLARGIDTNKDQSYFLWTLSPEQLSYSQFPVGDSPKDQIRAEAASAGLITANKKDSQGVCFLGHINIPEFLGHYITLAPGPVINEQGELIGEHQGAFVYTIGQRQGFTLITADAARTPHFVINKNVASNTITVSPQQPILAAGNNIKITDTVIRRDIQVGSILTAQTRYRQKPFLVTVTEKTDTELTLTITAQTENAAKGQSCVLYDGEECLGGGIIS